MPKRKGNNKDIEESSHVMSGDNEYNVHKKSRDQEVEVPATEHPDSAVDYEDSEGAVNMDTLVNTTSTPEAANARNEVDDLQRGRILEALKGWCRSNITADGSGDSDVSERSEALAEVGMLLVFEYEKYPDSNAMRAELADIESIIGGENVVTKFVNFLLSLQNQVKKSHAIAVARDAKKNAQIQAAQRPVIPMSTVPMHLRPAAQPVLFSRPVPNVQHWPIHPQQQATPPQYTPNQMGAPRRRETEFEIKRNQILAECTEHLKTLIEKASKASDPKEKATILELIKKVKSRMESMKSTSSPVHNTGAGNFKPTQ